MTTSAPYELKQRRQTWYVRYRVPRALQALGLPAEITRTLQTRDKREAQRRAPAVAVQIQAELGMVQPAFPTSDVRSVEVEAERLRKAIDAGVITEQEAQEVIALDAAVEAHLSTYKGPRDPQKGHPLSMPGSAVETIQRAYLRVADRNYRPLSEWVTEYLKEKGSGPHPLAPVTLAAKRSYLDAYMAVVGSRIDPRNITRQDAGRYVQNNVKNRTKRRGQAAPVAEKTMQEEVQHVSSFFAWLEDAEVIPSNPFRKLSGKVSPGKRGEQKEGKRRACLCRPCRVRCDL